MYPFVKLALLGPMEKCSIYSPSFPLPSAEMCLSASRDSNFCPFLKPTKCWCSSKLMQMFQNLFSDICKCFSSLDKSVLPLKSLVLYCFQKEKVDRTIIQHLLLHWKNWWNLLAGWEDVAGKVLWKIYNQAISWHIKRKILIAVLAFIWIFFIFSFFFGVSFVDIVIWL